MSSTQLLAFAFALSQASLAILYAVVWRTLQVRWAILLVVGFGLTTAYFGNIAAGHYVASGALEARPLPINAALILAALAVFSAGVVDYVGAPSRLARRLNGLSIGLAALTLAGVFAGVVTRAAMLPVLAVFTLGWTALFVWAMLNHPRQGHGLLVASLGVYFAVILGIPLGLVPHAALTISIGAPFVVLGMTLLTTGLLRSQRRVADELAARAQAQAELLAVNETLEHRVQQRTAELRETIEGLESFNRSVSHDLRGPLGGIAGVAKLASRRIAAGDAAGAERLLEAIAQQADRSHSLIGALLVLARTGDATLRTGPVDTGALAREAVAISLRSHPGADPPAEVSIGPLPQVEADLDLLRQVFVNLIGNALKFTGEAPQPRIEVGARHGGDGPVFFVRDNGVGFDAGQAQPMFKPFQRLHGARFEGFGVGLSIVKRIVDRHGGRIWAESAPGRGATFFFTFAGKGSASASDGFAPR